MRSLALSFLLLLAPQHSALALEIKIETQGDCFLLLSGGIRAGDAVSVADAIQRAKAEGRAVGEIWPTVCLNSSGGSFAEGIAIAEVLYKYGIGTRVASGAKCYSACGVVFMGGRIFDEEFDGAFRYLHPLARLGFHAPFIGNVQTTGTYSGDQVVEYYDQANRLTAKFIGLATRKNGFGSESLVKPSLIQGLLETPRDQLLFVDNIEKLSRWGIRLYDYQLPGVRDRKFFVQACENYIKWSSDEPSKSIGDDEAAERWVEDATRYQGDESAMPAGFSLADFSEEAPRYCLISQQSAVATDEFIELCVKDGMTGIDRGECPAFPQLEWAYIGLPPDTALAELSR